MKATGVIVSLGIAIIMMGMPRAAALTQLPHADVTTYVYWYPVSCGQDGWAPANQTPYHLSSNPDTVRYSEDVNWVDNRPDRSTPTATHYYWMQTQHSGNIQSTDKTVYTDGQDSGSDTISLDVTNVYSGDIIRVRLDNSVGGPVGQNCPAIGRADINYSFVYP